VTDTRTNLDKDGTRVITRWEMDIVECRRIKSDPITISPGNFSSVSKLHVYVYCLKDAELSGELCSKRLIQKTYLNS
jgi:hypothetical protein